MSARKVNWIQRPETSMKSFDDDLKIFVESSDFNTELFEILNTYVAGYSDGVDVVVDKMILEIKPRSAVALSIRLEDGQSLSVIAENKTYEVDVSDWFSNPDSEQKKRFKEDIELEIAERMAERIQAGFYDQEEWPCL